MAMAMAGKQGGNKFWRELRHKGIWALYNPKLPIWPLIGLRDLAGDPKHLGTLLFQCPSMANTAMGFGHYART